MHWSRVFKRARDQKPVPLDVYASLVDALYDVRPSLLIGSIASAIAALITAWKADEPALYAFAVAIALVAWFRNRDMLAYARVRSSLKARSEYRRWEHRYVIGAAVYVALLSSWTFASFGTGDAFIILFSFSVTLAYLIGVSGRNFASDLLVTSQIICAAIPLSAALFLAGDYYFVIFGLVLLPFFAALRLISNRLRKVLLDAVLASREVSELARRFNTALNNMPQGLCMVDADRRLVVANQHVPDLIGIDPEQMPSGRPFGEILVESLVPRLRTDADAEAFVARLEQLLRTGGVTYCELADGRALAFTARPMSDGGSVVVLEDITERRNTEARINHLAHFDPLTGLPNRNRLREELDRALATMRRSGPLALLFVDLDEFKQVNDTLGHPSGDQLLGLVSERLQSVIRRSDVAARFGGDEFVVIQNPMSQPEEAGHLAQRIIETLSAPFQVGNHQVFISACVGITLAPRDGSSADRLLKNADMALYHAKTSGRASWRFFEPAMDAEAQSRRTLEQDLRKALDGGEFELFFQPIINLRNRRVTTCEALIRWRHPERGLVSPSDFIPIAEEMGLIVEIGTWVVEQACRTCASWPSPISVAVNLSPVQFRRDDIHGVVSQALARSGLDANRLEIEITESVLLQDLVESQATLEKLTALGVRISLDDFGTGYSGLTYLQSFPIHKVKIDRSFITDLQPASRSLVLLHGVAELCSALGIVVVVEGIETEEQMATVLSETSIDEAQGYLISTPLPPAQIATLIGLTSGRIGWGPLGKAVNQ
ncbi:MAG TPA: EAL domain-containing protein [Bauldia sp.]|nr:EAL domain-containing protein [Bauldia sp.]